LRKRIIFANTYLKRLIIISISPIFYVNYSDNNCSASKLHTKNEKATGLVRCTASKHNLHPASLLTFANIEKLALLFEQQSSSEFYYYAHDNTLNPLMSYELLSSFYGNGVNFLLLRCDAACCHTLTCDLYRAYFGNKQHCAFSFV